MKDDVRSGEPIITQQQRQEQQVLELQCTVLCHRATEAGWRTIPGEEFNCRNTRRR